MTRVSSDGSSKRTSWMAGMSWVWHLGGLTKAELAKRVWKEAQRGDVLDRAAQLSYYFLLSLFPLLIFLSAVLGQVFAGNIEIYYELLNYIGRVMPVSAYEIVRTTVDEITAGSSGRKLSIGLLATLWTASAGMNAVIEGLNVTYQVKERRPWWQRRIVAINLTILLATMSGVALALVLGGARLGSFLAERYGLGEAFAKPWLALHLTFPPLFMILVFAIIYRYAPNIRSQGWQALMPGTFVGVAVWLIATAVFRLYLSYFGAYGKTYGSLGAVIILMLWLYLSGAAILIGGVVNSEIRKAAAAAGAATARESLDSD